MRMSPLRHGFKLDVSGRLDYGIRDLGAEWDQKLFVRSFIHFYIVTLAYDRCMRTKKDNKLPQAQHLQIIYP